MINKHMKKREKVFLIASLLSLIFFISIANAANVGVSPASINFEKVLRGGYAERYVTISYGDTAPIGVDISFNGEIASWLNVSETHMEVSRDKPGRLLLSVSPDVEVPNGNYSGNMRVFINSNVGPIDQQAVGIVKTALDLVVTVEIVDFEIKECQASQFSTYSAEKGDPIIVNMTILNAGNTRFKPEIEAKIWDLEQLNIIKTELYNSQEIKPTKEDPFSFEISTDNLEVGQYWMELSAIDCYNTQLLTFDVLEPGALKAQGYIKEIISKTWVGKGETTSINVLFENTGEKKVNAHFAGKISMGDKIIQKLESESMSINPGEQLPFQFYFTPNNIGRYTISGIVIYDGKRTFEKSKILNVQQSGIKLSTIITYVVYLILVAIVAYVIYLIRRDRRDFNFKLR